MNIVVLKGRLTKDAELSFLGGKGTAKLTFNLAVDDGFGENKKTYFIPVTVWGKSAEGLSSSLIKGTMIAVKGKLRYEGYEDKEGNKKWATEVVADLFGGIEFCGGGKNQQGAGYGTSEPAGDEFVPVDDGDMPF